MNLIPSEAQEQEVVIQYCDLRSIPIFAIPNGGTRNKLEAVNLKRQGVKAGVPDLCLPIPKGKYASLYIEMKRVGKSTVSQAQKDWIALLNKEGNLAVICYGADEAIDTINNYLRGKHVRFY